MIGQFTLSYHFFEPRDARNHLELFLDRDGASELETWRAFRGDYPRFKKANNHRRAYLEFSGEINGGRGRLRILRRGAFNDCRRRKENTLRIRL